MFWGSRTSKFWRPSIFCSRESCTFPYRACGYVRGPIGLMALPQIAGCTEARRPFVKLWVMCQLHLFLIGRPCSQSLMSLSPPVWITEMGSTWGYPWGVFPKLQLEHCKAGGWCCGFHLQRSSICQDPSSGLFLLWPPSSGTSPPPEVSSPMSVSLPEVPFFH